MLMKKSVNGVPPPSVVLASPGSTLRSASLRSASLRCAPGEAKTTEGGGTPFTDFFMSISFSALYTKSRKGRRLTDLGTEGAAGCGFALGGAWAGRFLGVLPVGVDLGLGGGARFVRLFHIRISGRGWPGPHLDARVRLSTEPSWGGFVVDIERKV